MLTTVLVGSAPRSITLQVGSTGGTIDNLVFDVTGTNVSPGPPAPVTNLTVVPFRITANRVNATGTTVTLSADSSIELACVAGTGCGTTTIPFTTISWTSDSPSGTTQDIQSGTFSGTGTQQLAAYANNVRVCTFQIIFCFAYDYYDTNLANNLRFTYSNATLYPSGQYRGRVTFTATMP
ncbi:MAG: hypothetical protein EOO29_43025 [Comamonadaceae bacterium]|nr:MAG: hypothetical protein EOO29_43025 [Comamonadaceae bacterium]